MEKLVKEGDLNEIVIGYVGGILVGVIIFTYAEVRVLDREVKKKTSGIK